MNRFVADSRVRVDLFLSAQLSNCSRKDVQKACKQGAVFVNGKKVRHGHLLEPDDIVEVRGEIGPVEARSVEMPALDVVFEDESLAVINKERGLSSVRLRSEDPTTVADLLVSLFPQCLDASPDRREAGLVQRLDRWTSGLMIAAKNRDAWERLRALLLGEKIEKSYLAVVQGEVEVEEQLIRKALTETGKNVRVSDDGEPAQTEVFVRGRVYGATLVECWASRARRHQIRVHLASIGHPLLGDSQYGALGRLSEFYQLAHYGEGFLLHAATLRFHHPFTGEEMYFTKESAFEREVPWRGVRT